MKKTILFISICVLCLAAQAQVVKGVSRTGEVGTAEQSLQFVDQFGRIVAFPALSPTGEVLDAMRPSVLTNSTVTDITKNSAVTGGKIVAPGASAVTECGVCYSTSANPTVYDTHVPATQDANGNYTVTMTDLQPNTTYYVRAYATNAIGTSYGTAIPFTTRGDATITITGKSESKVYNGSEQSLTGYTVSIPEGVNIAATEISYSGSAAATGTNVGEYPLTFNAAHFSCSNPNYDVTFQVAPGKLTITPATATVTANDASKVYGAADPASFTATVTGLQGTDAASLITYSVTRAAGENVGTYTITPSGDATQGNYNVTYVPANLTITKATATVTADAKSKTYGAADPELTATVTGAETLNYTLTRAEGENVGEYAITVSLGENPNYNVTATNGTFIINKKAATVTADNKSKTYGASDPTLTATVSGIVGSDALNYTLARATGENVGEYAITVTLGSNPNYEVTTANGTFTINKATATVTADAKSKTYGAADPELTATVTGAETLNYTLTRAEGENVGEYAITVSLGENPNYNVTPTNGTFTITKATATVTADNKSKVYGTDDPTLTATVTGAETLNYTLTRAEGENAGTYAITVTLGENPNYNVTATNGTFTISKKEATVTVDAGQSKVYGSTEPTLTATVDGVVGNDALNYSLSRPEGENAGTYAITVTLGENPNYNVTTTNGTFTITKATATVKADNKSKTYGTADPELTATVTGAVNSETLNYTLARATGENAGEYAITVSLGENPNYNVTATNGTFTINKATATVKADNKSKIYGADDPTLTATVTGAVNNETLNYTLARATGENAGEYAITVSLGENPNYNVTATNGTFTITKATATVTADNKSKIYGEDDPTLTATVTGAETLNYTLTRAEGENVDEYAITVSLGENPNYNVTATNGTFTINKKAATVTADNKSKVAGENDPPLTATVTGTVGNDVLNYTLDRATGETVGEYAITVTLGENPNYNVTATNGTLTITLPPCPTLGTTTYTPDPVTGSATTITLTTPVTGLATGVTVTNPTYTASMGNTPVTVSNVSYASGSMTGTITITTAMRNQAITVTPSITTSGCSNPGTITGDAVEICVQPVLPSFGTVSNTDMAGKINLFLRDGSGHIYATINNYNANLIQEMGFYVSTNKSEVENHTCTPKIGTYGSVNIKAYTSEDFSGTENITALNYKFNFTDCGITYWYLPYMKLNLCGEDVYIYGNNNVAKSFRMWAPESGATSATISGPTISASPNPVSAGNNVTLTSVAYMTVGTGGMGKHSMEEWMDYENLSEYQSLNLWNKFKVSTAMSMYGMTSDNWWKYRWVNESTGQEIYTSSSSNHTGTCVVTPTQTTTYTAHGDFTFQNNTCRVSKSVTVTVQ